MIWRGAWEECWEEVHEERAEEKWMNRHAMDYGEVHEKNDERRCMRSVLRKSEWIGMLWRGAWEEYWEEVHAWGVQRKSEWIGMLWRGAWEEWLEEVHEERAEEKWMNRHAMERCMRRMIRGGAWGVQRKSEWIGMLWRGAWEEWLEEVLEELAEEMWMNRLACYGEVHEKND